MKKRLIGVIGGSGLGAQLANYPGAESCTVETPFGAPSGSLLKTNWNGTEVIFLNRHGDGHIHSPSTVPYRANIYALKKLGVTHVIASGAVGSLQEEIEPGHLVICDQIIDKTSGRKGTFFDEGLVAHVEMADPFCESLRKTLIDCADEVDTTVHQRGTYVVMEGPQFSTRAESHMHRQWGGDVIGMTCFPEAKLAREAEMCYALVALPTDYDCWRNVDVNRDKSVLLAEIIGNLKKATDNAISLIEVAIDRLAKEADVPCSCHDALELAIWSNKTKVSSKTIQRLEPLIGRYFT